jgi:hypothetical protein
MLLKIKVLKDYLISSPSPMEDLTRTGFGKDSGWGLGH